MRHSRKESHYHAKGYAVGPENSGRASVGGPARPLVFIELP